MIENRVEKSGLLQVDLNDFVIKGSRSIVDLKDFLFESAFLKENDFRVKVGAHDWTSYQNHYVGITCSVDTIIPLWAYMIITSALEPYAKLIIKGNKAHIEGALMRIAIEQLDLTIYQDQRVIIKGCGDKIPDSAYIFIVSHLQPVVKSILFGEACSSVPVFKKK